MNRIAIRKHSVAIRNVLTGAAGAAVLVLVAVGGRSIGREVLPALGSFVALSALSLYLIVRAVSDHRRNQSELRRLRRELEHHVGQREIDLERAGERYVNTLDQMLAGCQLIGFDWRYLYVNEAVTRHGRTTREQLIGRTMMECYPGIEETPLFATLRECMTARIVRRVESEFTYPDGEVGWFELSIQPAPEGILIVSIDVTERKRAELELQRSNRDLHDAYDTTIEGWSRALDLRDKETEGHTRRVTELTVRLARMAGICEAEIVHVRRGALLHDIGKMGVPDHILLKPDKLTDEEWVHMKKHPTYAYELLKPIEYLRDALDIPYCHHEKWDGSGYPRGLKGEEIPLAARLFAVVDIWDAIRSDRPYRKGWSEQKSLDYIQSVSGTHLDPAAVALFLRVVERGQALPFDTQLSPAS